MMSMLTLAMVVVMCLVLVTNSIGTWNLHYSCPVEKSYNFTLKNFSYSAASGKMMATVMTMAYDDMNSDDD